MKILHCHTSLSTGGVEAMITGLVNAMVEKYMTDVCLIYKPKETDIFIKKLNRKVKQLTIGQIRNGFSILLPFKIYRFISKLNYDVIQLHGFFYYYIVAIAILHKKFKFFYTVHNDAFLENTKWDRILLPLKKRFFKWGWIHPITISQNSKASFDKLYHHTDNTLIYNGIPSPIINQRLQLDIQKYRINNKTKVFINPARITEQKNQIILVQSFQKLINDGYNIVLLIAGQNQNTEILSSLSPYFSERIHYIGEVDQIPSLLYYCDGLCLSSLWEGLPVVLLEAMAVGCPSICTPVGGIVDIVETGRNGFLSSDCTVDAYYSALVHFLKLKDEEIDIIKKQCIYSFNKFEIHNTANKYLDTYSQKLI